MIVVVVVAKVVDCDVVERLRLGIRLKRPPGRRVVLRVVTMVEDGVLILLEAVVIAIVVVLKLSVDDISFCKELEFAIASSFAIVDVGLVTEIDAEVVTLLSEAANTVSCEIVLVSKVSTPFCEALDT